MAHFDMRGQRVTNQYNAGRDINFGTVQTSEDFVAELEKLSGQIAQAKDAGLLGEEIATDAQYQVAKAVQQAKKPDPDKKTLIDYLSAAKTLLSDITAIGELVTALAGAIQMVQKLFS